MKAPYDQELEKAGVKKSDSNVLLESMSLKDSQKIHVLHEDGPGANFLKNIENEQKAAVKSDF